jgi:hypothetical protein
MCTLQLDSVTKAHITKTHLNGSVSATCITYFSYRPTGICLFSLDSTFEYKVMSSEV